MRKKVIGITGTGWVGTTLYRALSKLNNYEIIVYDWKKEQSKLYLEDGDNAPWAQANKRDYFKSDIIFVCVSTPMCLKKGYSYGNAWLTPLFAVMQELRDQFVGDEIVIKSTIPPGTTKYCAKHFGGGVFFNPEFLTEKNAYNDFVDLPYQIIGNPNKGRAKILKQIYWDLLEQCIAQGGKRIIDIDSDEAEIIKYARNNYLAVRLSYFQEIENLCRTMGLNYGTVSHYAGLDDRVGQHYNTITDQWGGHCLGKDIQAMMWTMKSHGIDPKMLQAAWDQNLNFVPENGKSTQDINDILSGQCTKEENRIFDLNKMSEKKLVAKRTAKKEKKLKAHIDEQNEKKDALAYLEEMKNTKTVIYPGEQT